MVGEGGWFSRDGTGHHQSLGTGRSIGGSEMGYPAVKIGSAGTMTCLEVGKNAGFEFEVIVSLFQGYFLILEALEGSVVLGDVLFFSYLVTSRVITLFLLLINEYSLQGALVAGNESLEELDGIDSGALKESVRGNLLAQTPEHQVFGKWRCNALGSVIKFSMSTWDIC
jgi:hypothetical protein